MLTLNQVVRRIKTISLQHLMLRNFYFGSATDFLNDKQTQYPSLFLQDQPGNIDLDGKTVSFPFKAFFLDLEDVSEKTQKNTLDVQSDMTQVATDLLAQFDFPSYEDWEISGISNTVLVREEFDDFVAGVAVDFTVTVPYDKDTCSVPDSSQPAGSEIFWSWFDHDPYGDIDTETFLFHKLIRQGSLSYACDFTAAAENSWLAIKEPATEPEKNGWKNTDFNYGIFPDQVFKSPVIIDGSRYYVTRIPVVLQDVNTSITINV